MGWLSIDPIGPTYLTKTIKTWLPILTLLAQDFIAGQGLEGCQCHQAQLSADTGSPSWVKLGQCQIRGFRLRKVLMFQTAKLINLFSTWVFHYKDEFTWKNTEEEHIFKDLSYYQN